MLNSISDTDIQFCRNKFINSAVMSSNCSCDPLTVLLREFFTHILSVEDLHLDRSLVPEEDANQLLKLIIELLIKDYNCRLLLKTANIDFHHKPNGLPSVFIEHYNTNECLQWIWHKWIKSLCPQIQGAKCPQIIISRDAAAAFLSQRSEVNPNGVHVSSSKLHIASLVDRPKWRIAAFQLTSEDVIEKTLKYLLTPDNGSNNGFCKSHSKLLKDFSIEIAMKEPQEGDENSNSILLSRCISNVWSCQMKSSELITKYTPIPFDINTTNVIVAFTSSFKEDKDESKIYVDLNPEEFISQYSETVVILYNYARLKSILERYEGLIASGEYPQIPSIHEIDFSLISKSKEELPLIYMLMLWPRVLQNTINPVRRIDKINLSFLFDFVKSLARAFDAFYGRNIIIVSSSASHNFRRMFARLYLLQGVGKVIKDFIELTGIEMD